MDIQEALEQALEIQGAAGAALVDFETGMCLGHLGGGNIDLELAAAGNTEVVRAKKNIRDQLGLDDKIEDILINLESQYHLIRMFHNSSNLFFYLVLDKKTANLALARMQLKKIDHALKVEV